jgi:hypothetical protein
MPLNGVRQSSVPALSLHVLACEHEGRRRLLGRDQGLLGGRARRMGPCCGDKGGIAIDEKADTGTVISGRLLEMADEVQEKKLTTAKAIAEAKKLIETNTRKL